MTTFLRTRAEVAAIVDFVPFSPARPRLEVALCHPRQAALLGRRRSRAIEALETKNDRFAVDGREVYWLCRTVSTESLVTTSRAAEGGRPDHQPQHHDVPPLGREVPAPLTTARRRVR